MEAKQQTVADIIEQETLLTASAQERYPVFQPHAVAGTVALWNFMESVVVDGRMFVLFLSHAKKHLFLAFLSTIRLHQVQAKMNLRQALEAGSCAAFAIANPENKHFVDMSPDGSVALPSQRLATTRYKWLDRHYPGHSATIKEIKDEINDTAAHENPVYAHNTFRHSGGHLEK